MTKRMKEGVVLILAALIAVSVGQGCSLAQEEEIQFCLQEVAISLDTTVSSCSDRDLLEQQLDRCQFLLSECPESHQVQEVISLETRIQSLDCQVKCYQEDDLRRCFADFAVDDDDLDKICTLEVRQVSDASKRCVREALASCTDKAIEEAYMRQVDSLTEEARDRQTGSKICDAVRRGECRGVNDKRRAITRCKAETTVVGPYLTFKEMCTAYSAVFECLLDAVDRGCRDVLLFNDPSFMANVEKAVRLGCSLRIGDSMHRPDKGCNLDAALGCYFPAMEALDIESPLFVTSAPEQPILSAWARRYVPWANRDAGRLCSAIGKLDLAEVGECVERHTATCERSHLYPGSGGSQLFEGSLAFFDKYGVHALEHMCSCSDHEARVERVNQCLVDTEALKAAPAVRRASDVASTPDQCSTMSSAASCLAGALRGCRLVAASFVRHLTEEPRGLAEALHRCGHWPKLGIDECVSESWQRNKIEEECMVETTALSFSHRSTVCKEYVNRLKCVRRRSYGCEELSSSFVEAYSADLHMVSSTYQCDLKFGDKPISEIVTCPAAAECYQPLVEALGLQLSQPESLTALLNPRRTVLNRLDKCRALHDVDLTGFAQCRQKCGQRESKDSRPNPWAVSRAGWEAHRRLCAKGCEDAASQADKQQECESAGAWGQGCQAAAFAGKSGASTTDHCRSLTRLLKCQVSAAGHCSALYQAVKARLEGGECREAAKVCKLQMPPLGEGGDEPPTDAAALTRPALSFALLSAVLALKSVW